ncbi:DUF6799 domain-containing protein [Pedobacter gandavensis]|uniref:DUF6799 domain-containing protein n=1 Tax=Pedobacter gandavensis TaxID=2679963 RepID=A0ABR6ESP2_9SPHI|nr:DUF6799 domain-containing protein [Pedobacter gandavensis]MBB2147433.1 hypothetical protein [Pedobacter gandavensis]
MKKLFLMVTALVMLSCGAVVAQDSTMHKKMKTHKMSKAKDHIMMKDGKMWVMKNGMHTEMKETMTLPNGTMVMTDGMVKMKDGKTMMMKNGNSIDMMGKMMPMKMKKTMESTTKKETVKQ